MSNTRKIGDSSIEHPAHQDGAIEAGMSKDIINIPENVLLDGIKTYPEDEQDDIIWAFGYATDQGWGRKEFAAKLAMDWSRLFKVATGTYEASLTSTIDAIRLLRAAAAKDVAGSGFVETLVTRRIFDLMDYAKAGDIEGGKMALIAGPTGRSKSHSVKEWAHMNNHGLSCYVDSPESGGLRAFMYEIARRHRTGSGRKTADLRDRLIKGFNRRKVLIVDEAQRLMPNNRSKLPTEFEFIRRLHDHRHCAVVLIVNNQCLSDMTSGAMQGYFEQLLGRVEPLYIPDTVFIDECRQIVTAFTAKPTDRLVTLAHTIANEPGRIRVLFDLLRKAAALAKRKKQPLNAQHLQAAWEHRQNRNRWPEK